MINILRIISLRRTLFGGANDGDHHQVIMEEEKAEVKGVYGGFVWHIIIDW